MDKEKTNNEPQKDVLKQTGGNGKIAVDGKVLREKPGFFKRLFHNMGAGTTSKETYTDPNYSQIRYEADKFAFRQGLSSEEAKQVGNEVAEVAKREGVKWTEMTPDKMDSLLRQSTTFSGTNEGLAYLDSKFGLHSQQELKARELADKIISEMPELDIQRPGKAARDTFDMGLTFGTGSSWSRMFIDPKDFALQREAANLAFSMGMSKQDSLQVGEEVYHMADKMGSNDKSFNLNDLLAQSPTFSTYEQGVQYLQRAKLDMAVEQIHEDNNARLQAAADYQKQQAANELRSKYNMAPLQGQAAGMAAGAAAGGIGGSLSGLAGSASTESLSQGKALGGFGDFLGSPLGRVLLAVMGFFITKLLGGNMATGLIAGGAGGLLSPVLGNIVNGFSSQSGMAQQGIDQLSAYERQQQAEAQRAQAQARQQDMVNGRGIEDGRTEQQGTREASNAELMGIVREKGIDGVHAYFGADEKRFNEFLSRNNLNEIAHNESRIRLEGGDWLKATRDQLAALGNTPGQTTEGVSKHVSL